jgi:hypothetical protein
MVNLRVLVLWGRLQNNATATELADVLPDLPGNDEDGYRLINEKH